MATYGTGSSWSPSSDSRVASSEDPSSENTRTLAADPAAPESAVSSEGEAAGDAGDDAAVEEVVVLDSADSTAGDGTAADEAPAARAMPGAGESGAEWSEIKALFVDDPAASVQRASALVERAVEGFMSALRERQGSLGGWQEGDANGTEELRMALRGYRSLFDQLEQMSGQLPAGKLS